MNDARGGTPPGPARPAEEPAARARLLVGEETPPCESPCPGCGAYYFAPHEEGCEFEQCTRCGGARARCECA